MIIKMLDPQGLEIPQEQEEMRTQNTPIVDSDLLIQSVGQIFNMRPQEIQNQKDKINLLIDYAKTVSENHSPEDLKWAIRALQSRVGTPPLGEKWLPYLSKYAWLKLDEVRLKKEVEQYEHNR